MGVYLRGYLRGWVETNHVCDHAACAVRVRSHGFKAATRYRDFKHIAAFSVTKLLFQVIAAPLERKLEDGLETLLLLERHTTRVVAEERKMREGLEKAGLKMTLRMEVGARTAAAAAAVAVPTLSSLLSPVP